MVNIHDEDTLVGAATSWVDVAPRSKLRDLSSYERWVKRPMDVVLAASLLVGLAPVAAFLAVCVPLMLGPGDIIYRQQRVGRDGVPFTIYKFRSMLMDRRSGVSRPYSGPDRRSSHKSTSDPRHTDFGRIIRAFSLDELPQLLNVVKGDMSLVGPRPELLSVAEEQGYVDHPRIMVRPGLTGLFQISPLRATSRIAAGLHLDVAYVSKVSFWGDLAILVRTVSVLFVRRGR